MVYVYAVLLTLLNLVLWFGILFNLPGTWLMVLFAAILEWWQPGQFMFSWTTLLIPAGLALLGEVLELVLGAAGSRQAGGSKRAAALAIVGSFIGGIVGTALPVPLVGTLSAPASGPSAARCSGIYGLAVRYSRASRRARALPLGDSGGRWPSWPSAQS